MVAVLTVTSGRPFLVFCGLSPVTSSVGFIQQRSAVVRQMLNSNFLFLASFNNLLSGDTEFLPLVTCSVL